MNLDVRKDRQLRTMTSFNSYLQEMVETQETAMGTTVDVAVLIRLMQIAAILTVTDRIDQLEDVIIDVS